MELGEILVIVLLIIGFLYLRAYYADQTIRVEDWVSSQFKNLFEIIKGQFVKSNPSPIYNNTVGGVPNG